MKEAGEQNQEVVVAAKNSLRKLLQHLEEELGDQPYLVGDFSLTDAALKPR
jgi:glutathione S-transferase